jgi:hypothetical protein
VKWWPIRIECPQCEDKKSETIPQAPCYSADGQLRFTAYCPTCKIIIQYQPYATFLAYQANRNDIADEAKNKPVHPPPRYRSAEADAVRR